ncbi:sensor histidine kinase [Gordoniibacillus kamchatkensis]|nr:HAMP domain-containing sensor histidine kinase [Paenibacillus sp. VKM B-2647]
MMQLLLGKTRQLAATPAASSNEMSENLEKLSSIVGETQQRLDQLYKSFKTTYLQLKPVQAHELFKQIIGKLQIPERIHFLAVKPSDNPMILADEAHFAEALANIIINAFEAIGKEKDGQVTVRMYTEASWLIVTVEDNGPGIQAEHLDVIFDPFYTSKNTNKNWGVGLSYVKQIVHGHFGHIHVDSRPGVGSTFQVLIPIYLNAER